MKILGISGFHDSSTAIIVDGIVESFLKEERVTRKKRDIGPYKSFLSLFREHQDIDHIACIDPFPNKDLFEIFVTKFTKCPIHYYFGQHHLCHASLAFYNSGFENCLVFVIDRNGSVVQDMMRESESVFEASYPDIFKTLHKNYWIFNTGCDSDCKTINVLKKIKEKKYTYNIDSTMSIVKVYESATTLIGQNPLENGKTMGLASYGKDLPFKKLFDEEGRPRDNLFVEDYFIKQSDGPTTTLLKDHLYDLTENVSKDNYQFYADYAYQVQKQTQERVLQFVTEWVNKTGIKNVCITGGYGLNVVSNEYLIKKMPDINFYFEPLADDSGNSIGAALHLYRGLTKDINVTKLYHTFFNGFPTKLKDVGKECTVDDIAEFLIKQKTVAVFNGLAEAGPRALGNRSILFDPKNPKAKDIVNKIKKREWYRPFAGMILEEYFDLYFDTHGWKKSEFMTVSFQSKSKDYFPGITHVDGSCRVQTVGENIPHIRKLMIQFFNKTGCPALLNTSFNLAGDPLIETQQEAIECFYKSELDVLWFPEIGKCLTK